MEKVIRETGYQPNQMAQSLAQGYSNTVALIVGNISSVAQIEIAKSIRKKLYENHLMVWLCNSDYDSSLCDAYIDASIASKLAGAFLVTVSASSQKLKSAAANGLPVVLINQQELLATCDSIMGNDLKAAYQATCDLFSLGHQKIALLTSTHTNITSYNAYLGYRSALETHGLPVDEKYVYEFDVRTYSGTLHPRVTFDVKTLFERTPDATAVICSSNEAAVEFYVQCRKLGKQIPNDLSLVCLDPVQSNWIPEITFCTYGAEQHCLGQVAVEQMLRRIEMRKKHKEQAESNTIVVEPSFVKGNSVRPI